MWRTLIDDIRFRLARVYDLEVVSFLSLLLSAAIILDPRNDVFSSGRAYSLISHIMTEPFFGAIIAFLCALLGCAIWDGGMRFRKRILIGVSVFWSIQFTLFITALGSGYITWLVSIFALMAIIPAARLSAIRNQLYE